MLRDDLTQQIKDALKARDSFKASALRMLVSAINNREIEKRGKGEELVEQDIIDVLKRELKKRNESAEMFAKGGRQDLADNERKEAELISGFLPAEMSDADLMKIVDQVLAAHPDANVKSFGMLMKEVMAKADGQADGSRVSAILKGRIS